MNIRLATDNDMGDVVSMAINFLNTKPYGDLFVEPRPDRLASVFELCRNLGVVLVAHDDERFAGFIAAVCPAHPFTGQRYADEVAWWVEPEYRSGLTGPKLLRSLEDWARQNGCDLVKMVAPNGAISVTGYLERVGYAPVETAYTKRL